MAKRLFQISVLLLSCQALAAFEEKPWLGNQYEFVLDSSYSYSRFSKVANAKRQLKEPFNVNLLCFDLAFCPVDGWEIAFEADFAATTKQSFGRRSLAAMLRARFLDDIVGDPVSLTAGLIARMTSHNSLKDISCPSSARWDVELHSAVGKEWSTGANWSMRLYGIGAVGQGSHGWPWAKAKAAFGIQQPIASAWEIYSLGYWGFGPKDSVNIRHFHNGWGSYNHSSIDAGVGYTYCFEVWGSLRFDVFHRFYAHVYPKALTGAAITYHLPFSPF
jgi:hypothetical protein